MNRRTPLPTTPRRAGHQKTTRWSHLHLLITLAVFTLGFSTEGRTAPDIAEESAAKVALGRALFFDVNLSLHRNQSCASCHDPARAFTDGRDNAAGGVVSLGSDGESLGDRNAPSAAYARFSPRFHIDKEGKPRGGQFLDGRAATLADQAAGPPLNPLEMAMSDKAAVVDRIAANPGYVAQFETLWGPGILENDDKAYAAMTNAIAAFEMTDEFAPFDSKYDRYLRGEYTLTPQEDLGMTLFFSQQFTNCNRCHQLKRTQGQAGEIFSDYSYHNIGVPVNAALRATNGLGPEHIDHGLLEHRDIHAPEHDGQWKTPTLRNVAVTGP
ncbi:MAG: cytochrome-c peroxidase, partial [Gammaproteobacteria bacterium]